ncbi:MAG: class B sortase [Lachnospiraceae bacterium]|nr:class B sortase [Lachnospiraceae bacterium]
MGDNDKELEINEETAEVKAEEVKISEEAEGETVDESEEVFELDGEGTSVEKPKKKFKLISFKTKSDTITSLIIIVALVVVIFAGINIIKIFANYKQGTDTYDELGNIVSVKQKPDEIQTFILDFNALKAVCPDAVGWIWQQGTMSYPIVQTNNNDYYLNHLYDGTSNSSGTLFVDYRIPEGMDAQNCIVYGHNMQNHSMFGTLNDYKRAEYFEDHKTFEVYCGEHKYIYYVFSAYVTDEFSETYTLGFGSPENFQNYIDMVTSWSRYDTGVVVNGEGVTINGELVVPTTENHILTLSTCTGLDGSGDRMIVHLVRGAEVTENTENATEVTAEF